jgi:hypothetical protein
VKIAKADLVPTAANLLAEHGSFAEMEVACSAFCDLVNADPHRVTRRMPADMLADGRARLRPVPAGPFTTALGVTAEGRAVAGDVRGRPVLGAASAGRAGRMGAAARRTGRPHSFGPAGPAEVSRYQAAMQGSPRVGDAHYSPGPRPAS